MVFDRAALLAQEEAARQAAQAERAAQQAQ
jgi:hypothetical protein